MGDEAASIDPSPEVRGLAQMGAVGENGVARGPPRIPACDATIAPSRSPVSAARWAAPAVYTYGSEICCSKIMGSGLIGQSSSRKWRMSARLPVRSSRGLNTASTRLPTPIRAGSVASSRW